MSRPTVLIAGTGLIGTSIALGLRHRRDVLLQDPSPEALAGAVARGAGRVWDGVERVDLVVVCAPPQIAGAVLGDLIERQIASTYTHTASVQSVVQAEVESLGVEMADFVGGHPMAGREQSGPAAATAELFSGRPWVICPARETTFEAIGVLEAVIAELGAQPVVLDAADHDRAVATVSHLPQLAASALAAQLAGADPAVTALAGPGLQDSTRIAASDPVLWEGILALNASNVAPLVHALADDLSRVAHSLDRLAAPEGRPESVEPHEPAPAAVAPGPAVLAELLARGVLGRELVPRKRGESDAAFASVAVSVADAPGRLAALLTTAGAGGVNVEDVRVDHVPDSPRGVIELLVRPAARATAVAVLQAAGWNVLGEDRDT
jgi:prephenate dehydrogenase